MSALETLLRRDRALTLVGLGAATALAWAYMLAGGGMDMEAPTPGGMGMGADMVAARMAWTPSYAAVVFAMWWVMMAAMMLPSAAPAILIFAKISRTRRLGPSPSPRRAPSPRATCWSGARSASPPRCCNGRWSVSASST